MSGEPRAIVTGGGAAHLRSVSLMRLIRFLALLALVLSSFAAFVATPASAAAHHSAMAANHQMASDDMPGRGKADHAPMGATPQCTDMGETKDQPCGFGDGDCVKACAAVPAIPVAAGQLELQVSSHGTHQVPALESLPHGLVPEAATPPPRRLLEI